MDISISELEIGAAFSRIKEYGTYRRNQELRMRVLKNEQIAKEIKELGLPTQVHSVPTILQQEP